MNAALYAGVVTHHRFRPRRHRLNYRMFWLLLDLDAPPARSCLLSHNRSNLFSFHDRDHLDGSGAPLRCQIERALAAAGIHIGAGAITVLCMPRVFGYVFNPISVYFCHRDDGTLAAMLYEVNNTFGQRHSYLIPVTEADTPVIEHECKKQFHVSPFLPMAMTYEFRLTKPGDTMSLVVHGSDADGRLISAVFTGERIALSDAALLRMLLRFGALTVKVVAAIYWEGLKLWLKGLRVYPVPAPPAHSHTIVTPR